MEEFTTILNDEMYVIINIHWDGGWWGMFGAEEIDAKVAELRKEHFTLRQQSKTGTLENPARIRQIRKDIARCLTEKNIRDAAVQA